MKEIDVLHDIKDCLQNLDYDDYTLDYFNILLKELDNFAEINDLDIHITITDEANHNTRLVIDMNK